MLIRVHERIREIQKERKRFVRGGVLEGLESVVNGLENFVRFSRWLMPGASEPS